MRRTLFIVTRDLVPAVVGSAGRRVAGTERKRLVKDSVELTADRGERWIDDAADAVEAGLCDREMSTRELREAIPEFGGTIVASPGTKWSTSTPIMGRLLTVLAADGAVVRADNGGHWRVARPRFTSMASWLGEPVEPLDPQAGYVEVVRSCLHTFGPGTEADIVWRLGSTKTMVRSVLTELDAVAVALDGRIVGRWVQDDDNRVLPILLEDISRDAQRLLDIEVDRLDEFLRGERITNVFASPQMRHDRLS